MIYDESGGIEDLLEGITIIILTSAIVSNSEMIKNYKSCREKAEGLGKIFVLKNNQPDAVLFSITEYERLSEIIECLENMDEIALAKVCKTLSNKTKNGALIADTLKSETE